MINREDFAPSRLPFYGADYTRLHHALRSIPVGQKNPQPDTSGLSELIQNEGRPTLIRRMPLIVFIALYPFAAAFFGDKILSTDGTSTFILSVVATCIGIGLYAAAILMAFTWIRELLRRNRIQKAWKNGWLRLYPVAVGSLVKRGRSLHKGHEDLRVRKYSALCLLLNPNGEWIPLPEQRFDLGYDTEKPATGPREQDFLVASSPDQASVDPTHNNGWALYMAPYGKPIDQGALTVDLSGAQERAVFAQMAKTWNLPFDSTEAQWW